MARKNLAWLSKNWERLQFILHRPHQACDGEMRWSDDTWRGWTVSPSLVWDEVISTTYRLLLVITANAAAAATLGRDSGDA